MQKTVLIGVLNWGLGHATRSIPIIDRFLRKDWNVNIASDGEALDFLKKEFPNLVYHELPGYNVSYPYSSIVLNIMRSSFSILKTIQAEVTKTEEICYKIKPQLIISDNRFGVRHPDINSIFVSHQINLKSNFRLFSYLGSAININYINKFNELWIPDFDKEDSLAGELSFVNNQSKWLVKVKIPHKYIGPLTRFEYQKVKKKYDIAIVISGPEPQRTKFEQLILKQIVEIDKNIIVIQGKVGAYVEHKIGNNILVKSYALSSELNDILNSSEIIISRSGYTTVMDLSVLGKKAIFVPTPGQTEQEYLAKYLKDKGFYYFQKQNNFNIEEALEQSKKFKGLKINYPLFDMYQELENKY